MRHPWFVELGIHEGAILRVLGKHRRIKRQLLRAQIKKLLRKDFSDGAFRLAYLNLLWVGWTEEKDSKKDGVTIYPRGRKNKNKERRERWLRNRNRMTAPYGRYGF